MTDDKDIILSRIRAGLKQSVLPQAQATLPPRALAPNPASLDALVESFQQNLLSVGGELYQAITSAAVVAQIIQLTKDLNTTDLLAWEEANLPLPGLTAQLQASGLRLINGSLAPDPAERHQQLTEFSQPLVGLTGALAGLADTGSIALASGAGRGRVASLLPVLHIALLPRRQFYPTMAAFLADHSQVVTQSSNLVFITGPSRTADIEMVITRGVHGPKRLAVVLLPEN